MKKYEKLLFSTYFDMFQRMNKNEKNVFCDKKLMS